MPGESSHFIVNPIIHEHQGVASKFQHNRMVSFNKTQFAKMKDVNTNEGNNCMKKKKKEKELQ